MLRDNPTEHQTRKSIIDGLLKDAGWNLANKDQIIEEFEIVGGAAKPRVAQDPAAFNRSGFSDYLLFDRAGKPLAVIEAKRTSRDPIEGKQQAEDYADAIKTQFGIEPLIFMTSGYETWFWNRVSHAPSMVHGFFSQSDLERIRYQNDFHKDLNTFPINTSIIDRDYQVEALKRVFSGLHNGRRKFLLTMATGTGKTRTAMSLIDVLLKAGWAQKVLFLADREALAEQAYYDGYQKYLPNESRCFIKSGVIDTHSRLFVSTIQTMMECFDKVTPGFFDVIIADECHRSIYNKWRDVLSYFHSVQLGLTATPADFIERDTFRFFNCKDRVPDFNYDFETAVNEDYLTDFRPAYSAQTNFQITGIKGQELPPDIQKQIVEQGMSLDDIDFEGTDLERKVSNIGTNEALVKEFMEYCVKDDSGMVPGKSIIFAISHNHARHIWEIFNNLYPEYKGKLVEIIDSKMERPLQILGKFKNENYPRVAISVDMLDTGVDVREVVNLVFAKPVFSKIKFWQMIGRGTRKLEKDPALRKPWCTQKDKFLIIDHWRNFEFFGEKPEGNPPALQEAISIRIFKIRLEKLRIFQQQKDTANFDKTKAEIIEEIKSLPQNSITVRENRKNIDTALSNNIWGDLDTKSFEFLDKVIAPLIRFKMDFNLYKELFVLKAERAALATLKNDKKEIIEVGALVIKDLKCLPRNLNAVKAKEKIIEAVIAPAFWQDLTYQKAEGMKDDLADILRHKLPEERAVIKLDLDDLVASRKWIEFGPLGQGDYIEEYRKKVEQKITNLAATHPVLSKIKMDIPITDKDLADLENTLNSPDLYITEDNLRKVYSQPYGSFTQFIKFVLGHYEFPTAEELINQSFNTYIVERNNKEPLTPDQLRFLRTIKNVFAKKKHIEYQDLFEPPFHQFGDSAALRFFHEPELREIVGILNAIKI